MSGQKIDQSDCVYVVTQYLLGQEWGLISPQDLAKQITLQLPTASCTQDNIHKQVWLTYGAVLHDSCCDPQGKLYEKAWGELKTWLERRIPGLHPQPEEPEVILQETLAVLHQKFLSDRLNMPMTLFAYALQVLRNKNIDYSRRQAAVWRGGGNELYLEELEAEQMDADASWEDKLAANSDAPPGVEKIVIDEDISQRLREFFQKHLPSPLQYEVAVAHFVDGLSPIEIAGLMGKRPHEIRLAKARVVKALRILPPEIRQELLSLLDAIDFSEKGAENE